MAGRGRGRGRGTAISAIADTLGVGRGEMVNLGTLQPPPTYPPREFIALPLPSDKDEDEKKHRDENVAYTQHFRQMCRKQPYYIRKPSEKKGIERYTDRYREASQVTDNTIGWTPNWSKVPDELRIKVRTRRPGGAAVASSKSVVRPNLAANRNRKSSQDVKETLERLEKKETEEGDEEDDDKGAVSCDYDTSEDENEERTDYNMAYFDNGEEYGFDDEDGLDDEGTFNS